MVVLQERQMHLAGQADLHDLMEHLYRPAVDSADAVKGRTRPPQTSQNKQESQGQVLGCPGWSGWLNMTSWFLPGKHTPDMHWWHQMITDAYMSRVQHVLYIPDMVKVTFLIMTTAKVPPDPPNMFRDHERSPLKRFARPPELLKDEEYELTATAPRNSTKFSL